MTATVASARRSPNKVVGAYAGGQEEQPMAGTNMPVLPNSTLAAASPTFRQVGVQDLQLHTKA